VCDNFKIAEYPTVLVLKDGSRVDAVEDIKLENLKSIVDSIYSKATAISDNKGYLQLQKLAQLEKQATQVFNTNGKEEYLTESNFNEKTNDKPWLLVMVGIIIDVFRSMVWTLPEF
jgi:thioredoxin-like negative regulator of GroEL